MLTYEVGPRAGPPAGPVRRADRHAVLAASRRGIPAPAFCEAIEDARRGAAARLRHRPALVLRHPGRGRAAGRRGDAADRAGGAARRADQLRAGRARDRRAAAAVQAVLRPGPRGRAAQRPARGRDHRAGDDLGRAARARRRADRARHLRRAGPAADGPPGRAPDPAGGVPDLQRADPGGRVARRAPARRPGRRRACRSASTPTTRRCSAPRSRRSTRSPPGCSTSTPPGSPSWPAPRSAQSSCRRPARRRCSPRSTPTRAGLRPARAQRAYSGSCQTASTARMPIVSIADPAHQPAPVEGRAGSSSGSVSRRLRSARVGHVAVLPSAACRVRRPQPGTAVQLWCRWPVPVSAGPARRCAPKRCAPTPTTRSPTVVRRREAVVEACSVHRGRCPAAQSPCTSGAPATGLPPSGTTHLPVARDTSE